MQFIAHKRNNTGNERSEYSEIRENTKSTLPKSFDMRSIVKKSTKFSISRHILVVLRLSMVLICGSILADSQSENPHISISVFSTEVAWNLDDSNLDVERLENGRIAVLTTQGILEFGNGSRTEEFYPFKAQYKAGVQFVRINSELYVLGMKEEDSLWGFNNDIHLLKYGESTPTKVWRCSSCGAPQIIDFYDGDSPLLVFASTAIGNQELRVVQLGSNEEWRVNAAGYNLHLQPMDVNHSNTEFQDICIHMTRDRRHYPGSHEPSSVRLSDIDFTRKRSHIKDFG